MTVITSDALTGPTSQAGRPDLAAYAWAQMNDSEGSYLRWRDAYRGRFEEVMLIDQDGVDLRVNPNEFTANFLRPLIDDLVHSLEIANFTTGDESDATSEEALSRFRQAWEAQRMPTRAPIVHRGARIDGDAFVLVWEGDGPGTVNIDFNSATDMRAFFVPGTDDEIDFVAKRWAMRKGVWRINLYFADRIEKFIHADEVQSAAQPITYGEDAEHWARFYEDGTLKATLIDERGEEVETDSDVTDATGNAVSLWPLPNPVGRVPIVLFTNRLDPFSPYGVSDLENALRLQNALNKLDASEFLAHEYLTKRARVILHADDSDFARATGNTRRDPLSDPDDPHDESGEAARQEREEKTLHVYPGDVVDAVGSSLHELSTEEPAGFIASKREKKADFAITNGLSLMHVLPDQGAISGEAYRRSAMMNTIKKQAARRDFGAAWSQVAELVAFWLDLGEVKMRPEWAHDDSVDVDEFWQQVAAKLSVGVPAEQILLEAGYPAFKVKSWAQARQSAPVPAALTPDVSQAPTTSPGEDAAQSTTA